MHPCGPLQQVVSQLVGSEIGVFDVVQIRQCRVVGLQYRK
jgi:hypothetical protein